MTDDQYYAKEWLNRMYNLSLWIESLEKKRESVLASLSGIARYDADFTGSNGENATETKNIEYSILSEKIERESEKLAAEDIRTLDVICKLGDSKEERLMKTILNLRYVERYGTWTKIADKIHYSESRTHEYHLQALQAISEFIPKEVIEDEE